MSTEYYQTIIDRGGGMISCGDHLGVYVGIAELACPPGWVFVNIEDATVEGISKAVEYQKKGRKTWPGKKDSNYAQAMRDLHSFQSKTKRRRV